LDADGDGKLTEAELRRVQRAFRQDDLDEDEALTLAELLSSAPKGVQAGVAAVKLATDAGQADATLRVTLGEKPGAALQGREVRLSDLGGVHRVGGPGARWWLTFRTTRSAPDVRSAGDFLVSQFEVALGDGKSLTKAAIEEDASLSGFLALLPYAD